MRIRKILFKVVLVGLLLVVAYSVKFVFGYGGEFIYWFEKGFRSTNPDEQIECFTKALDNWTYSDGYENKANTYYNRGNAYYYKGEYDRAIEDYNKAIKFNPECEYPVGNIGFLYFLQGKLDSAINQFDKALRMKQESLYFNSVYWVVVLIYKEKGDKEKLNLTVAKAEEYIKNQIDKKPKDRSNYADLAEIYCDAGVNPDDALSLARKAVELKSDYRSYYVLARAYLLNGDVSEAVSNFEKSLELNPNNVWCLYWLGKVWKYQLGDSNKAMEYFDRGLKVNPKFRFILDEVSK